jgi:peptidoglycan/LPS O-acetylase OafA/YrhL
MSSVSLIPKPSSKRILELDALRAISCLNLLLFHFTYVYANKYGFESPLGFTFPYGKYGVQLFFMLSGFVNAMTFVGKRSAKDFVFARAIRIFPSYWLVILLNVVLLSQLPLFHSPSTAETVANLTTLPRLFGFENLEPVTWTLQIEMLFYATLVIMMLTGAFEKMLRNLMIMVGTCLVFCLAATGFKYAFPDSGINQGFWVIENVCFMRNMPLFAMGMLLNEIKNRRGNFWHNIIGIAIAGAVFHAIDLRDHNPAATALLFGLLTACAWGKVPPLRFKPLLFISTISYTLYLFHNNVGSACIHSLEMLGISPLPAVVIVTVLSIGLGTATTIWFEQPITQFLRHWYKRRQDSTSSPTPAPQSANIASNP